MGMHMDMDMDMDIDTDKNDNDNHNNNNCVKPPQAPPPDTTKGGDGIHGLERCNYENDDHLASEEAEDRVFELALAAWVGLLQVASPRQLGAWYKDRKGLGADQSWQKKKQQHAHTTASSVPPSNNKNNNGGLFMLSLLLDLLEELQFGQWMMCDNNNNRASSNGSMSMSSAQLLSGGLGSNTMRDTAGENSSGGKDRGSTIFPSSAIPRWYNVTIAVLAQVGRTEQGMEILRTRSLDDRQSDWMGNALDVSIRHLHTLSLHLDDVHARHGSIARLGECTCAGDRNYVYYQDDPHAARLRRSVEAWVRLWHQVLLFVQSKERISFRSLVLDLREWFTSSCATLLTSEEIRPEIRSMIRWQLDELVMDEEDYEESKHRSR